MKTIQSTKTLASALMRFARSLRSSAVTRIACAVLLYVLPARAATDTVAPQLVSFSITPSTVNVSSAAQTVTATMRLTDNLSGVSYGQAYFYSPSNNQNVGVGFGTGNRISGTDLDGTYQSTMSVQRYAEAGDWKLNYIYVADVVGNTRYYYAPGSGQANIFPAGTATTLTVQNPTPDTTAPEVSNFAFTPNSVDVGLTSRTVTATMRMTDGGSGVSYGQVTFYSPSNGQNVSVGFGSGNRISGTAADGIYQATMTLPRYAEAGDWKLNYIYTADVVNNYRYSYAPGSGQPNIFPVGTPTTLTVQDATPDSVAPQMLAFDFNPKTASIAGSDQTLTATMRLTDNLSGVSYGQAVFYSPSNGQNVSVGFGSGNRISGTALDGTYQSTMTVRRYAEAGDWKLNYIYVGDAVGNYRYYYAPGSGQPNIFPTGTATTLVVVDAASGPGVVTQAASALTSTAATLNGRVNPNGYATTAFFQYGTTTAYGTTTTSQSVGSGTSELGITAALTGLVANTTYHFRIGATNLNGTVYGSDQAFTTGTPAPTVTTGAATNLTASAATLNGTVNPQNSPTSVQFQYGTTISYGSTTVAQNIGSGNAAVAASATLGGLAANTTYHYRVVATNSTGTTNGADQALTTALPAPTANTTAATGISGSGGTLNASVNPSGLATTAQFEWGTTISYGSTTAVQNIGSGTSAIAVNATLSGLSPAVTIHFRVVATNSSGATFGGDQTFTTLAIPPTVATGAASAVAATTATLGGTVNANGLSATATFSYGTTVSYGSSATAAQSPVTGSSATAVSAAVSGLAPHRLYHFRASGTNSGGTVNGSDATFTTANTTPTAPDGSVTGTSGNVRTVTISFPATDGDGDTVAITGVTAGAGLTVGSFTNTTVTFTPAASFVGNASFTYTVGDGFGGSATGTITVTVSDTTAPVVAAHANVTAEATSAAGAVVSFAAGSATDAVGVTSLTYSQASGTSFPMGVTTVTITARDAANNAGTGTFTVTVQDTTAPVVAAHANVTAEATSAAGAVVDFAAGSATDAVGVTSLANSLESGTTFPIGVTTVTITAADAANNVGTSTFTVTVADTTAPAVAAHVNVTAEATSAAGAVVNFAAGSATDVVTASPAITYSQESGTTFPIGVTTVTISAEDAAHNVGTGTFTVTVQDTTAPVVAAHGNVTAEATSAAGAVVSFAAGSATDAVGVTSLAYSQESGTSFPLGVTTVMISAEDAAHNVGTGTFTVTVGDTTAPVVAAHANVTAEATSAAGAVVSFAAGSATDAVTVTSLAYSQESGTSFPLGVTTVTITARDAMNNVGTGTFTVTVGDTTAPAVAAHANVTAEATSAAGSVVSFAAGSATDAVTASLTITYSQASGTSFPLGVTTVTISAEDAAHNVGTGTFTVTVGDMTAPVITLNGDATLYAALDSTFTDPGATALDAVGGAVSVNVTGSVDTSVAGDYTLTYTAEDAAHNAAAPVARTVTVYLAAAAVDDVVTATAGETRCYPLANDYDPLGSELSLVSTDGPGVMFEGRALVIPAGYVGTFRYVATNGRGPSSANVTVLAGTPVTARSQWAGLLYDRTGAIAGRMQTTRNSAGRFTYGVRVGADQIGGIFTLDAMHTATVGGLTIIEDADHRLTIAYVSGGTLTGNLRQSATGVTPRQLNVALAGADRTALPGGGYLRAYVRTASKVNILGVLPDGRSFVAVSPLADNSSISFYISVRRTPGAFIGGEFTLGDLPATDCTGELEWTHASTLTALTANGSLYSAGAALPAGACTLTLAGGSLASPTTSANSATSGKPTLSTAIPAWLVKPAIGTFFMRVKTPGSFRVVKGSGIYLPKSHSAWGTFPGMPVSGSILLTQP